MNKTLKWSLVAALAIAVGVWGYFKLMPRQNEELAKAEGMPKGGNYEFPAGDYVLSPLGRKQAEFLGEHLKKTGFKGVVKAESEKVGPNDPCPCGSGLKYKKCCGKK